MGISLNYLDATATVRENTITENAGQGVYFYSDAANAGLSLIQNVIADNEGVGVSFIGAPILAVNNTITNKLLLTTTRARKYGEAR